MTSSLLAFALVAMSQLAPGRDHTELATAIVDAVEDGSPFFRNDPDRTRTLSLALAVAFRESTFRNDAIGDDGRSHCAFQIHLPGKTRTSEGWTGDDLRADVTKCVTVAFRMLRQSIRVDREHPIAFYARGPRYQSERARSISRDRVALAKRIHAAATAALAKEDGS